MSKVKTPSYIVNRRLLTTESDMDYPNIPFINILVKEKLLPINMGLELISYRRLVLSYIAALRKLYSERNFISGNIVPQYHLRIKKRTQESFIMRRLVLSRSWDMKYN